VTSGAGHRAFVVDDNPDDLRDACAFLESLGYSVRSAATVEAALAAIEEEEFCLYLLDQAVPLNETAEAFISGGERLVRAARAKDKRRTEDGDHVTPIVAMTNYSERSPFVVGLFEIGISTFVAKPLRANQSYFLEKIRGVLGRAGREEHAKCAALSRRPKEGVAAGAKVGIAIDGKVTTWGRTEIGINGERRDMQDSKLLVVRRGIAARGSDDVIDGWASRAALGLGTSRSAGTHVREAFAGLVPAGFEVLEADKRGNCRLNPEIVVETIDWSALAEHPDGAIKRLAVEMKKRARRST
jgi:CheY-like chemotaxis protein